MFSLESPHRGDSSEYTQYTICNMKKKNTQIIPNLQLCGFSKELKNEFETAGVNEPSVFEPLKFYCIKCIMSCHNKNSTECYVAPALCLHIRNSMKASV